MSEERVSVPNIGDAHDVAVVEVLVQAGARVEREQPLVVLESDKASMEIPSPSAGVVRTIEVKVGDKVSEGSPLLVLESGDGASAKAEPAAEKKQPAAAQPAAAKNDNGAPGQAKAPTNGGGGGGAQ